MEPSDFKRHVEDFFSSGGDGLNITIPYKHKAWSLAAIKSADKSSAANTLYIENDKLAAANTDGAGLVQDIEGNLHWNIQGENILLLGAGGAASAVIPALAACKPASITIVNRTKAKAVRLAQDFADLKVSWAEMEEIAKNPVHGVLINATPVSFSDKINIPPNILHPRLRCYDMAYSQDKGESTLFNKWASKHGVLETADGLGMLVEQAALAYDIWHGVIPDTRPLLKEFRNS